MVKPDTPPPPKVTITVDDELAYTVDQAAAKYGKTRRGMNSIIERQEIPPAADLDGNKKIYFAAAIEAAMAARPGKGWRSGSAAPAPAKSRKKSGSAPMGSTDTD